MFPELNKNLETFTIFNSHHGTISSNFTLVWSLSRPSSQVDGHFSVTPPHRLEFPSPDYLVQYLRHYPVE